MLVGNEWEIKADSLNVILSRKRKRTRKDTKETYVAWEVVGYFATLADALHELVNQGVRDTELTDIKTISARVDELHTTIALQSARALTGALKG